jgi:hypothetical protein
VLVALLLGPARASADPQSEARAHFRTGRRLFDHDHPAEARAEFEAAYAALPNARVLANIAACYAAEGQRVDAVRTYRRFLREATDVPAPARRAAQTELAELRESVGDLVLSIEPDGAEVLVDGVSQGTSPIADPIALEPGVHEVVVRAEGREEFTRRLSVYAGREANLSVVLPEPGAEPASTPPSPEPAPAPMPAPVERSTDESSVPPLVWLGVGVTTALVVGGVITGVLVLGMKSEYDDPSTSLERRRSLHDSTPTLALVTDVLLDTAVVTGLGTLAYYLFFGTPEERPGQTARNEGRPWDLVWAF